MQIFFFFGFGCVCKQIQLDTIWSKKFDSQGLDLKKVFPEIPDVFKDWKIWENVTQKFLQ